MAEDVSKPSYTPNLTASDKHATATTTTESTAFSSETSATATALSSFADEIDRQHQQRKHGYQQQAFGGGARDGDKLFPWNHQVESDRFDAFNNHAVSSGSTISTTNDGGSSMWSSAFGGTVSSPQSLAHSQHLSSRLGCGGAVFDFNGNSMTSTNTSTSSPWANALAGDGATLDDDQLAAFLRQHHFAAAATMAHDAAAGNSYTRHNQSAMLDMEMDDMENKMEIESDGAASPRPIPAPPGAVDQAFITDDTWAMLGIQSGGTYSNVHSTSSGDHGIDRSGNTSEDHQAYAAIAANAGGSDATLAPYPSRGAATVSPYSRAPATPQYMVEATAIARPFSVDINGSDRLPNFIQVADGQREADDIDGGGDMNRPANDSGGNDTSSTSQGATHDPVISRHGPMAPPARPPPQPLPSSLSHRSSSPPSNDSMSQGSRPQTSGGGVPQLAVATSRRVVMVSGPLAGTVVRFILRILQQPGQGRSFSERDRRAVIPPPILRLTLTESVLHNRASTTATSEDQSMNGDEGKPPLPLEDDSRWTERPLRLDHFDVSGLVCTADVIHLSSFGGPEAIPSYTLANNLHQSSTASSLRSPPPASSPHEVLTPSSTSMEAIRDAIMMPGQRTQRIDSIESSATGHTVGSSLSSFAPSTAFSTSPATGTSLEAPQPRRIRNLFGNTSVGGRQMLGPDETDPSIWFMFPDVSVKKPGQYALRFRCYDVLQMTTADPSAGASAAAGSVPPPPKRTPMVAECFSETFIVYTAKSYPPPPPISKLTEHFTR